MRKTPHAPRAAGGRPGLLTLTADVTGERRRRWPGRQGSAGMSSLDDFATDFDPSIMSRGRDYFRRGAVKITDHDEESVTVTL